MEQRSSDLEEAKMKVKTIRAEMAKVELELGSSKTKEVELQKMMDRKTKEFEKMKLEYITILRQKTKEVEDKKKVISINEKKNEEVEEQKRIISNLERRKEELEEQKESLERKNEVLEEQKNLLESKNEEIEEQKKIISKKNKELDEEKKILERKNEETLIQLRHEGIEIF